MYSDYVSSLDIQKTQKYHDEFLVDKELFKKIEDSKVDKKEELKEETKEGIKNLSRASKSLKRLMKYQILNQSNLQNVLLEDDKVIEKNEPQEINENNNEYLALEKKADEARKIGESKEFDNIYAKQSYYDEEVIFKYEDAAKLAKEAKDWEYSINLYFKAAEVKANDLDCKYSAVRVLERAFEDCPEYYEKLSNETLIKVHETLLYYCKTINVENHSGHCLIEILKTYEKLNKNSDEIAHFTKKIIAELLKYPDERFMEGVSNEFVAALLYERINQKDEAIKIFKKAFDECLLGIEEINSKLNEVYDELENPWDKDKKEDLLFSAFFATAYLEPLFQTGKIAALKNSDIEQFCKLAEFEIERMDKLNNSCLNILCDLDDMIKESSELSSDDDLDDVLELVVIELGLCEAYLNKCTEFGLNDKAQKIKEKITQIKSSFKIDEYSKNLYERFNLEIEQCKEVYDEVYSNFDGSVQDFIDLLESKYMIRA